jgi:hypothetical protein
MKSKLITLSLAAFIAACILSACNSPEKKADDVKVSSDSLAQSTPVVADTLSAAQKEWEIFKDEANNKIRQNEDSIRVFTKRAEKQEAKMKAKLEKKIARLEKKNDEMKVKLADYKDEGSVKWEKFKLDFNNGMDTLGTDIKGVFKGNKK